MRKFRKSINDIEKELFKIIDNSKTVKILIVNLKEYLSKLSSKESISKNDIMMQFCLKLKHKNMQFLYSPEFSEEFNTELVEFYKQYSDLREHVEFLNENLEELETNEILEAIKHYSKYNNDKQKYISNNFDKEIHRFSKLLKENHLIRKLIYMALKNLPGIFILEMIRDNRIPLNTLKYFIDYKKDIKENTEIFYDELKKLSGNKIPSHWNNLKYSIKKILIREY